MGSVRAWRRRAAIGIAAVALASLPGLAFAASFTSVPVGSQPCSVTSGDVNHDGKPDLVVPNAGSNTVSVLLNSGTGSFTPAIGSPFAVGAAPCSVAILDVTDDTDMDLVVANFNESTLSVLIGSGTGSFTSASKVTVGADPFALVPVTGPDFQCPALAVANWGSSTVSIVTKTFSVLLGACTGSLKVIATYPVGTNPNGIIAGDFNGDGTLDLATANKGSDNVSVLLGSTMRAFATAVNYPAGSVPAAVAVADLNGDGKQDLVVADSGSAGVSILAGAGNGTFGTAQAFKVGWGPFSVVAADLNGDAKKDLITANRGSADASVLLNQSTPTGFQFSPLANYATGGDSRFVVIDDFNADAKFDLAIATAATDAVSILFGNGDGTFTSPSSTFQLKASYAVHAGPTSPIVAGDFNGDGRVDLVSDFHSYGCSPSPCTPPSADAQVLLGNGDGTFTSHTQTLSEFLMPVGGAVADFDGDGKADLLTYSNVPPGVSYAPFESGALIVYRGNGDGTFQAGTVLTRGNKLLAATGDFTGDGKADIAANVVRVSNPGTSILRNTSTPGTIVFVGQYYAAQPNEPNVAAIAAADFNGDGKLDVTVGQTLRLGNGDGTLQAATSWAGSTTPSYAVFRTGDFNGDGKADIAAALGSALAIYPSTGATFGAPTNFPVYGIGVSVGDFNADGKLDVAGSQNQVGGQGLGILFGNGDGSFQPSITKTIGGQSLVAADFNADGRLDLATSGIDILLGITAPIVVPEGISSGDPRYNPPALDLGSQNVGTNGNKTFKFANLGGRAATEGANAGALHPYAVNISGPNASEFQVMTDTCTAAEVVVMHNCDLTVKFSPTASGNRSATLTMVDDAAGSPHNVALTGYGASPAVTLTPTSLDFSDQNLGTTSPARTVTLRDSGSGPLTVTGIATSADYAQTNNCGTLPVVLSANQSCTISVTFTPTAIGSRAGELTITDDAAGSPHKVSLTGKGRAWMIFPAMANLAYGGYTTAIYVQNVGAAPAAVSIKYFDSAGAPVGTGDTIASLALNANWTVRQDNGNSFLAGKAGSAVLTSDQPVAAFVNEFAPHPTDDATSYTGISGPQDVGTTLYAPAIANNAYGGYTTGIGIINTADSAADVTITYRDQTGTPVKTQALTAVPAHAYRGVYSGSSGQPDTDANLVSGFAGTATITSSAGALAAIVNEVGPGGQFSSYDAVAAGSTTLQAPVALNNAFGGYYTGMGVQNTTGTTGTVTVKYFDAAGAATTRTFPIAPYGYLGIYQGSVTDGPAVGAYTAQISSGVAIAASVTEVAPAGTGGAQQSTAYNTFTGGASTANLALVESAGFDGWSTGLGIMNTGTATTSVTVTYYDAATGAAVGTAQTNAALQPNAFWPVYQPDAGLPSGQRATAVVTTSAGGKVAVICNERAANSFMSYNGR